VFARTIETPSDGVKLRDVESETARTRLAAALPTASLVVLFALAAVSSPTVHRASHAGVLLAGLGCLIAAASAWTGMRFALELRSGWRVPLTLYGLAVGLFFLGETIAVILLNW
jgi:hypothetical protein